MGKLAFVFSGQGDQYPGMGREAAEKYSAAAGVYEMCDRLRPGTSAQCFGGREEELRETKNTQPCLFATELALAAVLEERGVHPAMAAGFSLGEVAAAAFCGVMDWETGFSLVCRRGELMQGEAERFEPAMAAVLKLPAQEVERLCGQFSQLYPVNYNCPGQTTVSGLAERMPDFFAAVKAAGGKAVPLAVKGAFHSPFMKEAAKDFAAVLAKAELRPGSIPLYGNLTARPYQEEPAELLARQICSPVRWEESIRNMIAEGADTFVEIGPGRSLTGMIRRIDSGVTAKTAMEYLAEVEGC